MKPPRRVTDLIITKSTSIDVYYLPINTLGNAIIRIRTSPSEYPRRDKIAAGLSISLSPDAIPWVGNGKHSDLRWHLDSNLVRPVKGSQEQPSDTNLGSTVAKAIGVKAKFEVDDSTGLHTLDVFCTLRSKALEGMYAHLPDLEDSVVLRETEGDKPHSGMTIADGTEKGITLVAGRPNEKADVLEIAYYALHDNLLHLYANIILRTTPFNEMISRFGVTKPTTTSNKSTFIQSMENLVLKSEYASSQYIPNPCRTISN